MIQGPRNLIKIPTQERSNTVVPRFLEIYGLGSYSTPELMAMRCIFLARARAPLVSVLLYVSGGLERLSVLPSGICLYHRFSIILSFS